MKSLILFRHGKSDWDSRAENDHERPVSLRGKAAARAMGRFLTLAKQVPDSIVTSSAVRARSTVELAAETGGWKCPVRITRALYEATPFMVLEEVRREPEATQRLLLAGHEPTWSELSTLLVGGGTLHFPTAAMVRIDFDIPGWPEVGYEKGQLIWLLPPKLFTEGDIDLER